MYPSHEYFRENLFDFWSGNYRFRICDMNFIRSLIHLQYGLQQRVSHIHSHSLQTKAPTIYRCTTDFITLPTSNRIFFLLFIFNLTHTLPNSLQTLFKICAGCFFFVHIQSAPLSRVILCVQYYNLHECHLCLFFSLYFLSQILPWVEHWTCFCPIIPWHGKNIFLEICNICQTSSQELMCLSIQSVSKGTVLVNFRNGCTKYTKRNKTKQNRTKSNDTIWDKDYKVSSGRWIFIKFWMQKKL